MKRPRHPRGPHFGGVFDGVSTFAELEARIAALPTEKDRGDAFEVFAEAYLATRKIHQAVEVWPGNTAPIATTRKLVLPDADKGVDGLVQQLDDKLAAYQVKFRTGRPALTWSEVSNFFGLADRADQRILFTNCDDLAEVVKQRRDFVCVRGADLDALTKDELAAIATWLHGREYKPVLKTPREHQQNALTDLERGLADHDRVTAVMACGSGKTLVALWLAERMGAKRILVLVPSLSLIRQSLHEWLRETRWERPRFLACCSDPTVASADDAMIVHPSDLDFPVSTDARDVRSFLEAGSDQVRVVFSTYQSAHVVGEAIKGLPGFELGVFDEAHKTAGRQGTHFAFALEDKHIAIAKRVFMTATPRHYDVGKKDKEGESALVYSMDEPKTYGPIVHTLTFTEAVRRGIICDCKIIISVVTSEMLNEDLLKHADVVIDGDPVRAHTVANQVALQKACEAHDLRKVFTFHSTVKSAADFTRNGASSVRAHLPSYDALHVSGAMATARREKVMQAFREAERAVMSNARCLTEGVDVPAVDLVAFLSPKKSKVDIVQAAGRAMRKAEGKQTGYVLLPLFVETSAGETIEDALERTDFAEAWGVIQVLIEQDEILADIIREMREERGRRGGFDDTRLRERIEVLGPLVSLNLVRDAVSAQVVERFGSTWDERYGELAAFKEREGHCNVPQKWFENQALGSWVTTQRQSRNSGQLSAERVARLNALGFGWVPRELAWEEMCVALAAFKEQHGHCNVPKNWPGNPTLGNWVNVQREIAARLSAERKARLDALGFQWQPRDAAWEEMLAALVAFKETHHHCNVPSNWVENPALAKWVRVQRATIASMSPDRRARLDALGFDWDPHETAWEEMYAALVEFKETHRHCNVPHKWADNPGLGHWVAWQRRTSAGLSPSRQARLVALGFVWDPFDAAWEEMYAALVEFKETHRHCNVPRDWTENAALGGWVKRQRATAERLSPDRRARLDALGFDWDPHETAWEEMFAALVAFKETHRHCNVPQKWSENPALGSWVSANRAFQKRGQLSATRKARLDALGFEWSRKD